MRDCNFYFLPLLLLFHDPEHPKRNPAARFERGATLQPTRQSVLCCCSRAWHGKKRLELKLKADLASHHKEGCGGLIHQRVHVFVRLKAVAHKRRAAERSQLGSRCSCAADDGFLCFDRPRPHCALLNGIIAGARA